MTALVPGADDLRAVALDVDGEAARKVGADEREALETASTTERVLVPDCLRSASSTVWLAVPPGGRLQVFDAILDGGGLLEPHGAAALLADDDVLERLDGPYATGHLQRDVVAALVQASTRQGHVLCVDGASDLGRRDPQ